MPGQSLQITGAGHSYFVRCVPADFPKYSATVNGTPQTNGLLVTPVASLSVPAGHYVVAFNAQGVAVWWYRDPRTPADAKFFGSSTIGWASGNEVATTGTFSLRGLNGSVKHTVGTTKMTIDGHDLQLLAGRQLLGDPRRDPPGRRSVDMGSLVAVDHHRQRDRRAERREQGGVELERGRAHRRRDRESQLAEPVPRSRST